MREIIYYVLLKHQLLPMWDYIINLVKSEMTYNLKRRSIIRCMEDEIHAVDSREATNNL